MANFDQHWRISIIFVPLRKHVRVVYTHLNPTFIIANLGYTGIYLIFLIRLQNIDCGYSVEPPRHHMF